jgi:hypothetical protein
VDEVRLQEVHEVGYLIGKQYWGKGVVTTALKEFLRLESVRPLYATIARHNPASIRVLDGGQDGSSRRAVGRGNGRSPHETGACMRLLAPDHIRGPG